MPSEQLQLDFHTPGHILLAIASDLHAYDTTKRNGMVPSHLCTTLSPTDIQAHPIEALKALITRESLQADILLAAGDFGDRANIAGAKYAWQAVQELGAVLGTRLIAATAGNHDLDSRFINGKFNPRQTLEALRPTFPLSHTSWYDKFWARHFVSARNDTLRLVVVNSCAYHGANTKEIDYGRISADTVASLRDILRGDAKAPPVNILLCHHHPQMHSELDLGEADVIRGGQLLLDMLGQGDFGDWLVIHGHKHHPKLTYAAGGNGSPIVFSAGSLCATFQGAVQTHVRNQFYLLDIDATNIMGGLIGRFRSWNWASNLGWDRAPIGTGLPADGGFGYRGNIGQLADVIAGFVTATGKPFLHWPELLQFKPELDYLMPSDMALLMSCLKRRASFIVTRDEYGAPLQIGRQI
jgi:hypothetical protein